MKKTIIFSVLAFLLVMAIHAVKKAGSGDMIYQAEGTGKVVYSHFFHVINRQIGCRECHSEVFKMNRKNFSEPKQKNESIMNLMMDGKFCGHCHNDKRSFTVQDNCERCHVADNSTTQQ